MILILTDHRHEIVSSQKARDCIDNQVIFELEAVFSKIRDKAWSSLWVDHEKHPSSLFEVIVDRFQLVREEVFFGSGNDKESTVFGESIRKGQSLLFHFIAKFSEFVFGLGIALLPALLHCLFPMAFKKIDNLFLLPGNFDQGVGDIFFSGSCDAAIFISTFKNSCSVLGNFVPFDQAWIFIRVNELVLYFARMVRIDFHQVFHFGPAVIALPEEAFDGHFIFQVFEDFDRLVRKAVHFGFSKIKAVVMPGKDVVEEG